MAASPFSAFGAPPWFFDIASAAVGACIGSFLNVVIVRLPAAQSISRPGSHCACGKPVAWHDNIPLFSWLALRGRARCCGIRISLRYPFVEALTAAAFLACWIQLAPGPALCGWVFLSALIAATFIDLEHLMIPDVLTVGLGLAGIVLSLAVPALHGQHGGIFVLDSLRSGASALAGLLIGSGLLLWVAVVAEAILKKEAMGMGDVIFAGAIGTFCGWQGALFAIFGGAAIGAIALPLVRVGQIVRGHSPAPSPPTMPADRAAGTGLSRHVPFGPMLAVAAALYLLLLHARVDAWFREVSTLF